MTKYYELLLKNKMITPVWKSVLELVDSILACEDKESYLDIFATYFSLIDDGNLYMNLDELLFINKFSEKVNGQKVLLSDYKDYDEAELDEILNHALVLSKYLCKVKYSNIVGDNKLFNVKDNLLYTLKFYNASTNISKNINRLFSASFDAKNNFNYKEYLKEGISLSKGQEDASILGLSKNLIITGGPGTGKTTSILFLLINLLMQDKSVNVYLTAPSGKASSRMKESINNSLGMLNGKIVELSDVINKIQTLDEYTIHHLLSLEYRTNQFKYNKNHQFNKNSIFVIDEASMIDVNIFNALLDAIPTGARVFIMGDKNQLPSVESGAIFGALLKNAKLKGNIVALDESKRFKVGTTVYNLAKAINEGGDLKINDSDFLNYTDFHIYEKPQDDYPVYYYLDKYDNINDTEILNSMLTKWNDKFYQSLEKDALDIPYDINVFKKLNKDIETARILSAENNGSRGVEKINYFFTKNRSYYPGELLMITKNNKSLDLYNGDSGIVVKFNGDDTLYFMVNKSTKLVSDDIKKNDEIFKLDNFVFYPLRFIAKDEITPSYAITIHKSQGSDYENILVILPSNKGHPLLNRQILYTAITRTKGNTYILSNLERLNEAKDNLLVRDTIIE